MNKITQKQSAALRRIIARERVNWHYAWAGAHPCCGKYIVTDTHVAVIFCEKPENLPEGGRQDMIYESLRAEIERTESQYDHFLALAATPSYIKELRSQAIPWRAGETLETGAVPTKVTAQRSDGGIVEGYYNSGLVMDVIEAIGPGAMLYIGNSCIVRDLCSLHVLPKNWMEDSNHAIGYVFPLRVRPSGSLRRLLGMIPRGLRQQAQPFLCIPCCQQQ